MKNNIDEETLQNSNITLEKFMEHLTNKVIDLKVEYITKYHKNPKYIKIPLWCLNEIDRANKCLLTYSTISLIEENTEPQFMGMRICETETIQTIKEIEVF